MYKKKYEGLEKWLNLYNSYDQAKVILKKYNFKSLSEYLRNHKKLKELNLPYHPERKFKKDWVNWSDYLGVKIIAPQNKDKNFFISYKKYKKLIRANKIKTSKQLRKFMKNYKNKFNIPSRPHQLYKDEWKGWGELFGTGSRTHGAFIKYKEAKKIIQSLKIKSQNEFVKFRKTKKFKTLNIDSNPGRYKEFEGMDIFLNSKQHQKKQSWLNFNQAKKFIKKFNIRSSKHWPRFKKSKNFSNKLPKTPQKVYKDQWKGWSDFLGY
jgi:predicted amidophosphoribosyltransferase